MDSVTHDHSEALARFLRRVDGLGGVVPPEALERLRVAATTPISADEADRLLDETLAGLELRATQRGDAALAAHLRDNGEAVRLEVNRTRREIAAREAGSRPQMLLQTRGEFKVQRVLPPPTLNGREIRAWLGFVRVDAIELWDENSRLNVHIDQFTDANRRKPNGQELLDIMLSKMELLGLESKDDEFRIKELAESIAKNGVRVPPILDRHGSLIDGNRRVAACRYVLDTDHFTRDEKQRAEWIPAWQLDEFSDEDDAHHVVLALNFPEDPKIRWPKYVRAGAVVAELRKRALLEPSMDERREKALKREIALYFGIKTAEVTAYEKMIGVAEQFEEYHVDDRGRDEHEVKHKAMKYFEYFDELSKGGEKGVYFALQQNDDLRRVVFDLLLQDKFTRFSQIRHLKHLPQSPDGMTALQQARDTAAATPEALVDLKEHVDEVLTSAAAAAKERRELDPNTRIENFVRWLKAVPLETLPEKVEMPNLLALQEALQMAESMIQYKLEAQQRHDGRSQQ